MKGKVKSFVRRKTKDRCPGRQKIEKDVAFKFLEIVSDKQETGSYFHGREVREKEISE